MTGPHTAQLDRDHLDDHGLVDQDPAGDDATEKRRAPAATGALQTNNPLTQEQEF